MRAIDAVLGQTEAARLLPSWCSASESSGGGSWAGGATHCAAAPRNTNPPLRFTPRRSPRGGQRRENVQRCDDRIPSGRYATQETRGRPRPVTLLLRQRLRRSAREDVAAPAGIRPTQASPPLPTRRHDPHLPCDRAAHSNPHGSPVPAWTPGPCNVRHDGVGT